MLGNLLDNAQESCMKYPTDPEINIVFKIIDNYWTITIANSCPDNTSVKQETTKQNKLLHGYGLRNVTTILDTLGGVMQVQIRNGYYLTHVRLPINPYC